MEKLRKRETDSNPDTIEFGMVFEVKGLGRRKRTDLVIDVGSDNWFGAVTVIKDRKGYMITGVGATASRKNISSIIEILSCEQVIAAARRGKEANGFHLSEEEIKAYTNNAQKPTRILSD